MMLLLLLLFFFAERVLISFLSSVVSTQHYNGFTSLHIYSTLLFVFFFHSKITTKTSYFVLHQTKRNRPFTYLQEIVCAHRMTECEFIHIAASMKTKIIIIYHKSFHVVFTSIFYLFLFVLPTVLFIVNREMCDYVIFALEVVCSH